MDTGGGAGVGCLTYRGRAVPEEDFKKMLREVRESLERSQRMLESLEGRQGRRSSPPPPPPPPKARPSSPPPSPASPTTPGGPANPAGVSYTRRKTAAYDTAYLTSGDSEPRWESGERSAVPPVPPAKIPAEALEEEPPRVPEPPRPSPSEGRYAIIQPRTARKR
jgi:hypothetical protein